MRQTKTGRKNNSDKSSRELTGERGSAEKKKEEKRNQNNQCSQRGRAEKGEPENVEVRKCARSAHVTNRHKHCVAMANTS